MKYRTAGMVAYNVEWLKNHFDIERAVICGAQEPKTGHWIEHNAKSYECSECHNTKSLYASYKTDYCPDCGARMAESGDEV